MSESPSRARDETQLPQVQRTVHEPEIVQDSAPAVRIQKTIFDEASAMDASDIHIEPGQGATRVRYRVNGVLKESLDVPRWMHENLVVRIKVLACGICHSDSLTKEGAFPGLRFPRVPGHEDPR